MICPLLPPDCVANLRFAAPRARRKPPCSAHVARSPRASKPLSAPPHRTTPHADENPSPRRRAQNSRPLSGSPLRVFAILPCLTNSGTDPRIPPCPAATPGVSATCASGTTLPLAFARPGNGFRNPSHSLGFGTERRRHCPRCPAIAPSSPHARPRAMLPW